MSAPPPFTQRLPRGNAVPLVFDTPHSGRFYPPDFVAGQAQSVLRRAEDAYVDELIGAAPDAGIALIEANYPRAYIDLNRDADDIDPDMLAAPWPGDVKPSKKSEMGLGLIRRFVTPGVAIYERKLSVGEVRHRLDEIYQPYHRVLAETLARTKASFGFVWHVDWHSMKSVGNAMTPDGAGAQRPDFVVGDLDGGSAAREFTEAVIELLRRRNYKVALNDPYKGASIVRRYGRPSDGFHTLQIEINRNLYLDEAAVLKTGGFAALQADLTAFSVDLASAAREHCAG